MKELKALAAKLQTPCFIYDFSYIKARYEELKSAFAGRKNNIFYAVKANSNLSLLSFLKELGAGFDCVSFNEVKRALAVGAKPYKIILSGMGKSEEELREALRADILLINVESQAELFLLEGIAKELRKKARISIRVNPNVDAKTHPYICTGLEESKFGVDLNSAKAMYLHAHKSENLLPVGIHFHIGSSIFDISSIHEAAFLVSDFAKSLKAAGLDDLHFFDIGGGLGVRYCDEKEPNLYEYAQGVLAALKGLDMSIHLEPGRFLVANAGYLLTRVLYEKQTAKKRFIIVDAAMSELIRPALYKAFHAVEFLDADCGKTNTFTKADLVGGICESGDFLAQNIKAPKTKSGDLIAIKSAGAYAQAMSSNYNSRLKVAEYALENGVLRQIAKAQSFEQLVENESCFLKEGNG